MIYLELHLLLHLSYEKDASFKGNKIDQAKEVGSSIAEKASKAGIKSVVFDRNGYLYHGRIKALADSAQRKWFKILIKGD